TAPPAFYTLSLHDALPISQDLEALAVFFADRADPVQRAIRRRGPLPCRPAQPRAVRRHRGGNQPQLDAAPRGGERQLGPDVELRSEEHTSELQSRFDLVCR